MSGSGGYYKYRCKYWLTFNCPHWVWVNNAPCAHCLADGRESDVSVISTASIHVARDICVPQIEHGTFHYALKEIVCAGDCDTRWLIEGSSLNAFPTSTENPAATFPALERLRVKSMEKKFKAQQESPLWTGGSFNLE
ncbi:hypothetical protein BP5796_08156 [Coleophoma crateriformis]|uniref:Uncharacterized protein n=1 Tax=Coleophoma crateriformis TaxID=565419 RepID=A0A3D8RDM0_9HELO|nr:hypothetical protein BP5796_08156 [Coleophoma crateriformis]